MLIIGFYFLALLYTKVSKFDDLERKQRKLMAEMDDSIGAYLSELKDENDRLIEKLSVIEIAKDTTNEPVSFNNAPIVDKPSTPKIRVNTPSRPINLALKSYGESAFHNVPEKIEPDDRTKVINLHDDGQSIEAIAKALGKGKTEIELILKFR